jgi:hypothetical protein
MATTILALGRFRTYSQGMADKFRKCFFMRKAKVGNSYSVFYSPEDGPVGEIPDF